MLKAIKMKDEYSKLNINFPRIKKTTQIHCILLLKVVVETKLKEYIIITSIHNYWMIYIVT